MVDDSSSFSIAALVSLDYCVLSEKFGSILLLGVQLYNQPLKIEQNTGPGFLGGRSSVDEGSHLS